MSSERGRHAAIDQFRGLAVVLMVVANYLGDVQTVPPWLHHARGVGLTVIDLIAPMFVFAIALTFPASFARRVARDGCWRAVGQVLRRAMALVGIGCILGAGEILTGVNEGGFNWGVLQALGGSIVIALPLLGLRPLPRLLAGGALLGLYQVLLGALWLDSVSHSPHGGFQGTLSWAAMLVLGTALYELGFAEGRGLAAKLGLSAALLGLGLGLSPVIPISKNLVSTSYVLISVGFCGLTYAVIELATRGRQGSRVLSWWGRNPLLLYLLHNFLLALFVLPGVDWWHAQAPLWLVLLQALGLLAAMSLIAGALERRGVVIAL